MLKTKLETFLGIILIILSIVTSRVLEVLGYIYFNRNDRKKLKANFEKVKKKQEDREKQFQFVEAKFILDQKCQRILKLSDMKLIEGLQSRTLSATDVLTAYIAKAIQVTRKYNCITEFIPGAMDWAAELDSLPMKGPLHGIPVSIKEHCNIRGMDSTAGFAQFLFQPAEEDALIVKAVKELGGIPFVKTNVPQSLFTYGCGNEIYGETLNPHNPKLSPGGSSGGCASLLAAGGSVLSVGTDVGGSIRIPSHFCGVAGMKPTMGRMSHTGFRATGVLMLPVAGCCGFLARNSEMLTYAYKALYSSGILSRLDPLAVPIPWNENMFTRQRKKLRIGYFLSHEHFPLLGDTEAVVLRAVQKLRDEGHELIPFQMPDAKEIMECIWNAAFADLGSRFRSVWKGESVSDAAVTVYWIARLPLRLRLLIARILEFRLGSIKLPLFHSPLAAGILRGGAKSWDSKGLWSTVIDRKRMIDFIKDQWMGNNMDVLLCPAFPFSAIPYSMPGKILEAVAYTMPWNLFDFPAGVIPFGKESGKSINSYPHRGDFLLRMAQKGAKASIGMPIGVQVVGLPFQEEMVLHTLSLLESLR